MVGVGREHREERPGLTSPCPQLVFLGAGGGCLGDGGGTHPLAFLHDSNCAVGEMNGGELCVRYSEVASV